MWEKLIGKSKGKQYTNKDRTNLILITFDQWRGDWGDPMKPVTELKELKALAEEGLIIERCYTSSPQCVPARISWLTGMRPSESGVTYNRPLDLPGSAPSMIRELKDLGWHTAIVGKTHWSNHNIECDLRENKKRLSDLGFIESREIAGPRALQKVKCDITDDWEKTGVYKAHIKDLAERYKNGCNEAAWQVRESVLPNSLYPDIWIASKGIEMLQKMPTKKPWFLWISFVGPHEPFDTPKPWKGRNNNEQLPRVIKNNGWIDRLETTCETKKIRDLWKEKLKKEHTDALRLDYADHLQLLDDQLGKIIDIAKERTDYKNTAVAITSDHGEMLGDHEMLYKSTFLEPSVRVPFIYSPPQKTNQSHKNIRLLKPIGLTELIKFTIDGLHIGGKSKHIVRNCKWQNYAISEYGKEFMIVKGKIKVVYTSEGKAIWATDLEKDPEEKNNILENKNISVACKIFRQNRIAIRYARRRKKKGWCKIEYNK